ncbi:hypothetical protein [Deinococcus humi]|uniref:Uncharacterized protein n=1 Tax=Deinococcus humi TaxID=662880 RepID=A0A7W8JUZ9_9DEIO|nr:hypothetical protein [Deinococcus humi]MBB5363681.1 hypothetical protein [Deinococcus humi]GGO29795.1 hypothetical protein GCM10008949_23760 [Deinococcus humi]
MTPAPPPLFRFRDLALGVIFVFFLASFQGLPVTSGLGIGFRVVYFWALYLALRHWWAYHRSVAPRRQAHQLALTEQAAQRACALERQQASQALAAAVSPHLPAGLTVTPLDNTGVRLVGESGTRYHVYAQPSGPVSAAETRDQTALARREGATVVRLDLHGGPSTVQGQEIWLHAGVQGLAEQVGFWEAAALNEQAVRQRGHDVEAWALDELESIFATWTVRRGLLMRRGGDVDAVLTRPDGQVFSVDVKSHRGTPSLKAGVLYLGQSEKGGVQSQLHLQAQETGGQAVCWQPEAQYGTLLLGGLLFIGGPASLLQHALEDRP